MIISRSGNSVRRGGPRTRNTPARETDGGAAWRSVEYEEVYLRAYDSVTEGRGVRPASGLPQWPAAAFEPGRADCRTGPTSTACRSWRRHEDHRREGLPMRPRHGTGTDQGTTQGLGLLLVGGGCSGGSLARDGREGGRAVGVEASFVGHGVSDCFAHMSVVQRVSKQSHSCRQRQTAFPSELARQ